MWMLALAEALGAETLVVWQKPFARFDDQRWLVQTEVAPASPLALGLERPLTVTAWQLEAIVRCRLDDARGKLRQATCIVEDAAVRAHAPGRGPASPEAREVQTLAAALVGKALQLQAHRSGRIANVDFDGLPENNASERRRANNVRAMLSQVSAAFHMDLPEGEPEGRSWTSSNEPLLRLASPRPGLASARTANRVDRVRGQLIHQRSGRGTSTAPFPNPSVGIGCRQRSFESVQREVSGPVVDGPELPSLAGVDGSKDTTDTTVGDGAFAASIRRPVRDDLAGSPGGYATNAELGECRLGSSGQPEFLEHLELSYALTFDSVAVLDLGLGFPSERVWAVHGEPTASSSGTSYWANGRLEWLAPATEVRLGTTGLVGPPAGKPRAGLSPWVPVGGVG